MLMLFAGHHLIKPIGLYHVKRRVEQPAQIRRREDIRLLAVRDDAALLQENDARHLRRNFVNMVRHEHNGLPSINQTSDNVEVLHTRFHVEAAGRLIEDQDAGLMDERPSQQEPALFAGGHFREHPVFEMPDAQLLDNLRGSRPILLAELLMPVHSEARIAAGQHDIGPACFVQILVLQIMRDNAEPGAKRPHIPPVLPKKAHVTAVAMDRMDLSGQHLQERGFPGAVRTEDHSVASLWNYKRQIAQHFGVASIDGNMVELDKVGWALGHHDVAFV